MGASFGGGVAYSLVSGAPNPLQSAITTGMAFALFNGLFYQVRWDDPHEAAAPLRCPTAGAADAFPPQAAS